MKHQTLLHRTRRTSNPPIVGDNGRNTLQASASSASHKDLNSKVTTRHLNTDNHTTTVLLSTVVVSIRNASRLGFRIPSQLYHGKHGEALMLSTRNNQDTICYIRFDTKQVAHEIIDIANLLCHRARVVYVLGTPKRRAEIKYLQSSKRFLAISR